MNLTHTRREKAMACNKACYAMRETMAAHARRDGLNHAEALNAAAQVFSSILAGSYSGQKEREIVISAIPDLVRAYLPQWDKIYLEFRQSEEDQVVAKSGAAS